MRQNLRYGFCSPNGDYGRPNAARLVAAAKMLETITLADEPIATGSLVIDLNSSGADKAELLAATAL